MIPASNTAPDRQSLTGTTNLLLYNSAALHLHLADTEMWPWRRLSTESLSSYGGESILCCVTSQNNCATLTNYTLASPSRDEVYNATGLVIVITVQRFFWCALPLTATCSSRAATIRFQVRIDGDSVDPGSSHVHRTLDAAL